MLWSQHRQRPATSGGRLRLYALSMVAGAVALAGALSVATSALAVAPAATASATTGLVDGQVIGLSGTGFTPNHQLQVIECVGTASVPPKDQTSCEGLSLDSTSFTDRAGSFVNGPKDPTHQTHGITVYEIPGPEVTEASIKCGPRAPCVLYVGDDYHDFTYPHVFIPLQFGTVTTAPVASVTTPRPSHGASGAVTTFLVVAVLGSAGGAVWWVLRRRRAPVGR